MTSPAACLAAMASALLLGALLPIARGQPSGGFIRAVGTRFADQDCNDFVFAGANLWALIEATAGQAGLQRAGKAAPRVHGMLTAPAFPARRVSWAVPNSGPYLQSGSSGTSGERYLAWVLDTARSNNLTVLRFFGHGTEQDFQLQPQPGQYNEVAFTALDKASPAGHAVYLLVGENLKP